jgi:3-oxoacyl-[acyl-carrier protein] reductase
MQATASVLNISSIYGLDQGGKISMPLYSAAKAGIINFTQVMAQKYAPHIRFNTVAPGFTQTPHWKGIAPEYVEACLNTNLQPEFVQPEEIAKAPLFLTKTPHINAETLVVDAGRSKK